MMPAFAVLIAVREEQKKNVQLNLTNSCRSESCFLDGIQGGIL